MRGVITDWGGVLTTPILTTVQAWLQADSIDWDSYRTVMRSWVFDAYGPDASQNPVHALERGECSGAEFEQMLAARLLRTDGGIVTAEGILQRMFAASTSVPAPPVSLFARALPVSPSSFAEPITLAIPLSLSPSASPPLLALVVRLTATLIAENS